MARIPLATILTVAFVLPGCLDAQPPADATSPDLEGNALEKVQSLLQGLPCEAPFSGTKTTDNLRRLNLTAFDGGGPQEMDIRGNLLLAARANGFSTVDISDPTSPMILGHYGDAGGMLDVKFSPDNQTAIVGSYQHLDLVDIRHPDDPVLVGRWRFADVPSPPSGAPGQNGHMVFTARIKDQDWVFLAPQSSTGVWILRLEGPPEARTLKYVTRTLPVQGGLSGPHDIFVHLDPDLKRWVLYSADAFAGWAAFDVSDPSSPQPIVFVPNTDMSGTHTVQAAKIGGRRIVATSTEFGMNALKVWDASDLRRPVLIGYWTRQAGAEMLQIQHNFNLVEGRLYMAHYSLGLFVFDLTRLPTSPAGALELRPIAHYASSQKTQPGESGGGGFWDLVLRDGLLYAGSYTGGFEVGLHVIGYGCIPPGDARFTSVG